MPQEGNPNLGALEIDPADIPAEGNVADPAGREWPTTLQGWREHYRGGGLTYAKAGYLRYSRSPEQGQAARERARALSGQMPKEQYESLFAAPQLPADQPELELGPAFQNPAPPRSAPLNREPADQPELELGPAFQNPAAVPSEDGGPSPLVDWIGAARKNRGRSGTGGAGGIKAPPIASQVPPEPIAAPPSPSELAKTPPPVPEAAGAAPGLMAAGVGAAVLGWGTIINQARSNPGSIGEYMTGGRSERHHDSHGSMAMQGVLQALQKIGNIRSRM